MVQCHQSSSPEEFAEMEFWVKGIFVGVINSEEKGKKAGLDRVGIVI